MSSTKPLARLPRTLTCTIPAPINPRKQAHGRFSAMSLLLEQEQRGPTRSEDSELLDFHEGHWRRREDADGGDRARADCSETGSSSQHDESRTLGGGGGGGRKSALGQPRAGLRFGISPLRQLQRAGTRAGLGRVGPHATRLDSFSFLLPSSPETRNGRAARDSCRTHSLPLPHHSCATPNPRRHCWVRAARPALLYSNRSR